MGFSAGGELAALDGTKLEPESPGAADPVDRLDARPDFLMLVYPGGRPESFNVTKETPPTFLLVADDDRLADRTIAIYSALRKAGVSAELHIYARGGHGFGMHDTHTLRSRAGQPGSRTGWTTVGCSRSRRDCPEAILSPRTGATAPSQGRQPLVTVQPSDSPRRPPNPGAARGWEAAWGKGSGRDRRPGADAPGYVLSPRRGFWDSL